MPDSYPVVNPKFVAFEVPGRFAASLVDVCHSRNHVSIYCCILQSRALFRQDVRVSNAQWLVVAWVL